MTSTPRSKPSQHSAQVIDQVIMIIDVHSHAWSYPQHFTDDFRRQARRARAGVEVDLTVTYDAYRAQCREDVRTIVFGGKATLERPVGR